MSKQLRRPLHGILLLDKPIGMSSNQALQRVKFLFAAIKAGHSGSLDPLATGLLPIGFGEATKFNRFVLDADKTYLVNAQLGSQTSTGDREGEVIAKAPVKSFGIAEIRSFLNSLVGPSLQIPPMYSALKVDGQTLYQLARAGKTIERLPRPIIIHHINLIAWQPAENLIRFEVKCSKGTYIRTLVEDLATKMGTVGHLSALHRTQHGPFVASDMHDYAKLEALSKQAATIIYKTLLPINAGLNLPVLQLNPLQTKQMQFGQAVEFSQGNQAGWQALHLDDKFLGVAEFDERGILINRRLLSPDLAKQSSFY